MNNGNFLQYAGSKLGIDVGYGKCILVYSSKNSISVVDSTAASINGLISDGTILGVIRGWHTVTGAPVGEISVERPGTSEMKLVRGEIEADTLTFESNLQNRDVLANLVKGGSFNCILIDDMGNVFGEYSPVAGEIGTMLLNFSTKVTSSFQRDNATDKTIAVTCRYLVKNLSVLEAAVEPELIKSKVKAEIKVTALDYFLVGVSVEFYLKSKLTGEILTGLTTATADVSAVIDGVIGEVDALNYDSVTGAFVLTFVTGSKAAASGNMTLALSGADYYTDMTLMPAADI